MSTNIKELCDPFKILHIKEENGPVFVEIHPTNKCNLNCVYCSYKKRKQDKLSIGSEQLIKLCNDLIKVNVKAVCFSGGGEPTLHPDLRDAMRILFQSGIKLSLLTNGTRVKSIIDVAPFCSYILIHLSSAKQENITEIMGKNGFNVFPHIVDIKRQAPETLIGGRIVVNEHNKENIVNTVKTALKAGFDYVQCCPALNYEDSREYISKKMYEELNNDEIFDNEKVIWLEKPDVNCEKIFEECECLKKHIHATIKANGDVCICPSHFYEDETGIIGNINTEAFASIWEGDKHTETVDFINQNHGVHCGKCRFKNYNDILKRYEKADENPHKYFL